MQFILSAREFLYTRENNNQPKDDPVAFSEPSNQFKFIHSNLSMQPIISSQNQPREPFYIPTQQVAVFGGSPAPTFGTPTQQGAVFGGSPAPTFGAPVQQRAVFGGFGAVINPYIEHPIIKYQMQSIRDQMDNEQDEYSKKIVMLNLAYEICTSGSKEYIVINPANLYSRIQCSSDKLKGYTEKMIHQVAIEKGYKVEYDGNLIKLIPQ